MKHLVMMVLVLAFGAVALWLNDAVKRECDANICPPGMTPRLVGAGRYDYGQCLCVVEPGRPLP